MKKKKLATFLVIAIIVVLLFPIRMNLKDGGSVRYKSLVYEITKIHQFSPDLDGVKPYVVGLEINFFGMTIYKVLN